ncbi:MAG: hypothetical protein AB1Z23_02110 [Eubacteriales bacterium]
MKKISITILILICAVLLLSGCSGTRLMPTPTPMPPIATEMPQTYAPAIDSPEQSAKGTIINSREIANEAGGYYIPVPDAWMGCTSYEMYEDETYIYHITSDPEERVVNPILLHVGAAYDVEPANLYASADTFLQLDDVKFYNVPVLDFPYTQGTADAEQYSSFYDEIPMILQSFWVIDESKWADLNAPVVPPPPASSPFIKLDATVDGIMLGNDKQTFLNHLGSAYTPTNIETQEWDAIGATAEIYTYSFGTITFLDGELIAAEIYSTLPGPRGFGVGDNISDIMASFISVPEYSFDEFIVYYRANTGDTDVYAIVPPSCFSYETSVLRYFHADCYMEDNVLSTYTMNDLKEYSMYMTKFSFSFYYDASGTVTSYSLFLGAAE